MPFGVAGETLATNDPDLDDEEEETQIFEKHDKLLHGDRKAKKYVLLVEFYQLNLETSHRIEIQLNTWVFSVSFMKLVQTQFIWMGNTSKWKIVTAKFQYNR